MITKVQLLVIAIGVTMVFGSVGALEYYRPTNPTVDISSQTVTSNQSNPPNLPSGTKLYKVTFEQLSACGNANWGIPWAVTFGNKTEVQPESANLASDYTRGTSNESLSTIIFAVDNGRYHYSVIPNDMLPTSGVVDVNGSDVLVQIQWTLSCSSTAHSSSSSK